MALTYNKIFLAGRLTRDPELKTTQSGLTVCSIDIAIDRRGTKDKDKITDFFHCTAWRQTAEFITAHFKKGSAIFIEGNLQTRSWEKDGEKRHTTEVIIESAHFVENKGESAAAQTAPVAKDLNAPSEPLTMAEMSDEQFDESLPF